jgi:hypothetical protein
MERTRSNSVDSVATSDSNGTTDTFPEATFIKSMDLNASLEPSSSVQVTEFRQLEKTGQLEVEPLLKEDKSRFVLFPIQHKDVSLKNIFTYVSSLQSNDINTL